VRNLQVFSATADQIPYVLKEIGRLRERTFRAVGEGTGKPCDIDEFDQLYTHLFVWNMEQLEIVGSYRLGPTDEILRHAGRQMLYTDTLFRFRPALLEQLVPALELGRSFVRQEYQRSASALMLLWKGIGAHVVRNPRYKLLFGPVSISSTYQTASQQLMVEFLRANSFLDEEARLVRPRNAFKPGVGDSLYRCDRTPIAGSIDDVSELVAELEEDEKGVPVLLRQYLRLGGKLLAFNIDPEFANVVDGLVLMDLTRADPRVLAKYMGNAGAGAFLRYHSVRPADGAVVVPRPPAQPRALQQPALA
jgi:putative hemolysin